METRHNQTTIPKKMSIIGDGATRGTTPYIIATDLKYPRERTVCCKYFLWAQNKKKIGRYRVYETYPLLHIAIYNDGIMFIICAYYHVLCIRLDDLFELYFTNIKPKWGDQSIPRLNNIYLTRMAMDGIWMKSECNLACKVRSPASPRR